MTKNSVASQFIDIDGVKIHYLEAGAGHPILLLHDMPVSSYAWRHVIPHLAKLGRCVAPDLVGMGQSDKPDISYSLFQHIEYINKFIRKLGLQQIVIVMHGWGSLIGFDYAMKHESNCKGLVFYEAYLRTRTNDDASLPFQEQLAFLREQNSMKDMILDSPYLVDKTLPQSMLQTPALEDLEQYRKPYLKKGSGKVLYQYIQELLSMSDNSNVAKLITEYSNKLMRSSLPKLMLYSIPGFITTMATLMWAKEHLPHLEMAEVGEELHYAMESEPELMSQTISAWLQGIETGQGDKS